MGIGILYGAVFLLILLISCPIIYFQFKKKGKKRLGFIIVSINVVFVFLIIFTNNIAEITYTKTDAKNDLKLANLVLQNDFEIVQNEVVGMPERLQTTKLKISESDKIRILNEIRNDKSFRKSTETRTLYEQMWNEKSPRNKVVFTNYIFNNLYIRESYYRENDYVPTLMEVSITENSNILELTRIED